MNHLKRIAPSLLVAFLLGLTVESFAQSTDNPDVSIGKMPVIEEITPAVLARLAAQRKQRVDMTVLTQLAQTSPPSAPPQTAEPQGPSPALPQSSQPVPDAPASPATPMGGGAGNDPSLAARYVTARFPYSSRDKFNLFIRDIYNPFGLVGEGFNALVAQAEDEPPQFRGGMLGFGKRFGAIVATDTTAGLFGTFLFPSILHTDPRYFRRGTGSFPRRAVYAMSRILIVRKDSGGNTFNTAGWLSSFATTAVSNTYYPDRHRGFGPTLEHATINTGFDGLSNLFREFWPDIAHGLHIPVFVIRRTADPTFPAPNSITPAPQK